MSGPSASELRCRRLKAWEKCRVIHVKTIFSMSHYVQISDYAAAKY